MTFHRILAGVAAASLVAGCGGGGGGQAGSSGSPNPQQVAALVHQTAQCIRAHGAPNFPDPIQDKQTGKWMNPPGVADPPQSAVAACQSLMNRIPSDDGQPQYSAADMVKLRRWSKCVRENGAPDWPDPNSDGTFSLPARLQGQGKRPVLGAFTKCQHYAVGRGLHFRDPQSGAPHGN